MPKVFISHSWADNDISRKIAHDLKRDGAETWIDYARISGGESLPERISQALDWCDTLVLIWSKSASTSKWVTKEWSSALSLDKTIIPCLIDNGKLPAILCDLLYIDLKNFDNGYNDLCRALKLETLEEKNKIESADAEGREKEQIESEVQQAQDIQQTLLPSEVPEIEGLEIASCYKAGKEFGNDYFDFVEVDKDSLGILVTSVSVKGLPGALIRAMIQMGLRTKTRSIKSASEVLALLNDIIVKHIKKGVSVTLFYLIIDAKRRRINYASAGHNPMILYRQMTNKTYYLNPPGLPVDLSSLDPDLFKKSIKSDTIQLSEDDILLLYTDGITEAMYSQWEMFGEERLLDVIRKNAHLKADEFIIKLKDEIDWFTEGDEQNDDITVVVIKEKSTSEKIEFTRAQAAHQFVLKGKSVRDACEEAGITTYAYYNKYKDIFEKEGIDAYTIDETVSVEAKYLSIEEKTKIYHIVKNHPEYGAKRISEELNTETYGHTQINESRIYDELVRSRLNTRQLREAYIARLGKRKRIKPPGTPMLTLDGRIIIENPTPPAESKRKPVPEQQWKLIGSKKQNNEILKDSDVADKDAIGFQMLSSEMSFKREMKLESNKDDMYDVTDFSFDDLLNEIESDITFFDQDTMIENEVEFASDKSQEKKVKQMSKNEDLKKIDDGAIEDPNKEKSFQMQRHDRFREKHLVSGLKYYQEQNYKQAVEQFLKVVELYPDFKEAYSVLGNAYYRSNQIDEALESYERVKQIDPFDVDAYENTGVIYANMGRFRDAIKEWKTALEFRPDREDIMNHIKKAEEFL